MHLRLIILFVAVSGCTKAQSEMHRHLMSQQKDTAYYVAMWGQSNMVGRADVADIPEGFERFADTIDGVRISFTGETLLKLVPGDGNDAFQTAGDFGPDVSLLDTLFKDKGKTVYGLKYASGGTYLAVRPTADWNVASSGQYFDNFVNRIGEMQTTLQGLGKIPKCIAIIGMQGENDALDSTYASDYKQNLEDFITTLRTDVGDSDLPFIFGEVNGINASLGYRDTVRQAQYDICRYELNSSGIASDTDYTIDGTYLIDTDTYTFLDLIHYDAESTIQFGKDIFNAIKLLLE